MLEQITKVQIPFPITIEEFAIAEYAKTGRTVWSDRSGDAPIEPITEYNKKKNVDVVMRTATPEDIEALMKIPDMHPRFQILESVPYTHIIIGDEVPTAETLAIRKKQKENFYEGLRIAQMSGVAVGVVAWTIVKFAAIATFYTVAFAVSIVLGALCGEDPIVWARLPSGEWLRIASYYE